MKISVVNKILHSSLSHPQFLNVWYCEISHCGPWLTPQTTARSVNLMKYPSKPYLSMQRGKLIQHPSTVVPCAHWGRCQAIVWLCDWVRDHGIWYLAPYCSPPRSRFHWACTSWWCKEVAMRWQQAVICCVIRPFVCIRAAAPEPWWWIFFFFTFLADVSNQSNVNHLTCLFLPAVLSH